jgi:ubiquinone/menaquinone biosynthesis C-methylase UbiE
MNKHFSFDEHVAEYETWFDRYPMVFKSEVEALRDMLPEGEKLRGLEVGVGTGRTAHALGIKEGVDPSVTMRSLAIKRGVEIMHGVAEHLPYADSTFDFVLYNFCISYFDSLVHAFREGNRVLKQDGVLVVGFLDRNSIIGKEYEKRKRDSVFYRESKFYSVEKVLTELRNARFRHSAVSQTLFGPLDSITAFQPSREGHGEGSFVVVAARR